MCCCCCCICCCCCCPTEAADKDSKKSSALESRLKGLESEIKASFGGLHDGTLNSLHAIVNRAKELKKTQVDLASKLKETAAKEAHSRVLLKKLHQQKDRLERELSHSRSSQSLQEKEIQKLQGRVQELSDGHSTRAQEARARAEQLAKELQELGCFLLSFVLSCTHIHTHSLCALSMSAYVYSCVCFCVSE